MVDEMKQKVAGFSALDASGRDETVRRLVALYHECNAWANDALVSYEGADAEYYYHANLDEAAQYYDLLVKAVGRDVARMLVA